MNFCSRFLRLSVVPRCRERPQIAMCFLEWLGKLKRRATGLDASLSFFSTSRRCSRNRRRSDLYQKEALRQLSDTSFYAKIPKNLTSKNQKLVKDTIQNLIVNQELPDTATNLIINTPRTSCIYFLPKIHKPNNPVRPIVSACSCPTELISRYLASVNNEKTSFAS